MTTLHEHVPHIDLSGETFSHRNLGREGHYHNLVVAEHKEDGLFIASQGTSVFALDRHDAKTLLAALADHLNQNGK